MNTGSEILNNILAFNVLIGLVIMLVFVVKGILKRVKR